MRGLWHGLYEQMDSLMRASLERQGVDFGEVVTRRGALLEVIAADERQAIVDATRVHYLKPAEPGRGT